MNGEVSIRLRQNKIQVKKLGHGAGTGGWGEKWKRCSVEKVQGKEGWEASCV